MLASGFALLVAGSILSLAAHSVLLSLISAFLGGGLILSSLYLGLLVWVIAPTARRLRSTLRM
jgi:hypothetical protein